GEQDPAANCDKVCVSNLSISGPDRFCSTSDSYTIANLPIGTMVTWSAMPYLFGNYPAGSATINTPNSSSTTLTKTADGILILRASISNICGVGTVQIQKQVTAGPPLINIDGPYDPMQHAIV